MSRLLDRLRQRTSLRTSRGTAEVSVLVVAGSLLAGVLFGTGLTRTSLDIADGLTWFSDDPTGEVIQVNPATGRPETRIDVGSPGDELGVAQYDGRLIVTNRSTGDLTSFDLSSILVSGQRRVAPGGSTDVLHHDGEVYLVDRDRGTLASIDPVSTDTVGTIWRSPEGISDAAVDGSGRLWVVDPKGLLTQLRWSDSNGEFISEDERRVDHSGAGSVLVAHDEGVTLFGPDQGIVVQRGTGQDAEVVAGAPRLSGDLVAPESAPADLVPVSSPSTGTVVVVSDGTVHEVDVTSIGCSRPARPEVFSGQVFVPCPGDGKVVRLAADGTRGGDDIDVPDGGDPALVVDDAKLLINVPGAAQGVMVDAEGSVSSIVRYDDDVPSVTAVGPTQPVDPSTVGQIAQQDVSTPPAPTQNPTQTPTQNPGQNPGQNPSSTQTGTNDGPGDDESETPGVDCLLPEPVCQPGEDDDDGNGNGSGNSTQGPHHPVGPTPTIPTASPLAKPTNVVAKPLTTGEVEVSWSFGTGAVNEFIVQEVGGPSLARIPGTARKAVVDVPPGAHRFTVSAIRTGSPPATSNVSAEISSAGVPDAPEQVSGQSVGSDSATTATVTVGWEAPEDNGAAVNDYTVTAKDAFGTHTMTVTKTQASYTVDCGSAYCNPGPVDVSVVARNGIGTGAAGSATLAYAGPTPPPVPAGDVQMVSNQSHVWMGDSTEGLGTTTLTLSPPADWASFNGTCSWTHSGNQGGDQTSTYPCGNGSIEIPVNTGYRQDPDPGTVQHTIVFTAQGNGATSTSRPFTWTTQQAVGCADCPQQ